MVDITSTSTPPNNYPAFVIPVVDNSFSADMLTGSTAVGPDVGIPHDGVYFWYSEGDFGAGGQLVLESKSIVDGATYFPVIASDTPGAPAVKLMITAGTIIRVRTTNVAAAGLLSRLRSWID